MADTDRGIVFPCAIFFPSEQSEALKQLKRCFTVGLHALRKMIGVMVQIDTQQIDIKPVADDWNEVGAAQCPQITVKDFKLLHLEGTCIAAVIGK